MFSLSSFFCHLQEENEGTCPISSTSSSTCSTHLQDPRTRGRESGHGRQGEYTEAASAFTGHTTAGIPDIFNWGWQVRWRTRGQEYSLILVITWLTVSRRRAVCLFRVCWVAMPEGPCQRGRHLRLSRLCPWELLKKVDDVSPADTVCP